MIGSLYQRFMGLDRNFRLFLLANAFLGMGMSVDFSTFNNFLREVFHLGVSERTFLEFPREVPGFLVSLTVGLLYALGDIRMAAVAMILSALGMLLFAVIPPVYAVMLVCVFVYSTGQHLFMPLANTIGMSFAKDGKLGAALGKVMGVSTASLVGSTLILMFLQWLIKPPFFVTFLMGSGGFLAGAICMLRMDHRKTPALTTRFVLRKEYGLYYWLSFLFGARKQLFLTFGPWVIVDIFQQPVTTMTFLYLCIAVLGIFVRPLAGRLTDTIGEKKILGAEAFILIAVCLTYAFAADFFSGPVALVIIAICYILDQSSSSVGLARATYLKKIAVNPADVSPTLSLSVSIDHIASMFIPMLGGFVWHQTGSGGYKWVFIGGAVIAVANFISTRYIKIPKVAG